MNDGHHDVLRIPVDTSTSIIVQYFQETDEDHQVQAISLTVSSLVDPTWYVGIAEAHPDMEDIDERVLDVLIREGQYRDHWLPIRRSITKFMEDNKECFSSIEQ